MSRIRIPVKAYKLDLMPQHSQPVSGNRIPQTQGSYLRSLAMGLAVPSFWTSAEIQQAFTEANSIWIREANIEFSPITISHRTETVPADKRGMWIRFVNRLSPRSRGIGVGFVYDLPAQEGGWGGGRIALISGKKARAGLPGMAGNLLAHELGHVLINDVNHRLAHNHPSNLMYGRRNPRVANAGLLTPRQVAMARSRAQQL